MLQNWNVNTEVLYNFSLINLIKLYQAKLKHKIRSYEPHHEKTCFFCICENIGADQLHRSAPLFSLHIVQSFYFLNPKYQASSHLLSLYSSVCVGPGRKPQRQVFSRSGSYDKILLLNITADLKLKKTDKSLR